MNLRAIANNTSVIVNPNVTVTVLVSTGYTIGSGLKQVPSYATPISGPAQIQALDSVELRHLDKLNIQGVRRAAYLRENLAGIIRPDSKGGDIIQISGRDWLVVKVLETWPNWTKVAIVLQGD